MPMESNHEAVEKCKQKHNSVYQNHHLQLNVEKFIITTKLFPYFPFILGIISPKG